MAGKQDGRRDDWQTEGTAGSKYRLPTEAEWEYAARSGGKSEKYAGTSDINNLKDYAWYSENSGNQTHPVGTKKPNGPGLYDMSGNVWEWVQDWYKENHYDESPRDNPEGPSGGEHRVLRGGSWYSEPQSVRASNRNSLNPAGRDVTYGLCVAFSAR
ncbi:MAG: formylglycine-generating enzyme family protein [Nitrospirae bacterium]|nr:formylglycine-generating enzyme family protein [Nitrospirota bacterium]